MKLCPEDILIKPSDKHLSENLKSQKSYVMEVNIIDPGSKLILVGFIF